MRPPKRRMPPAATATDPSGLRSACRCSSHGPNEQGRQVGRRLPGRSGWRVLATAVVAAMALGAVALAAQLHGTPARQATATVGPTAGDFAISNAKADEAIFSAEGMRPGAAASGQTTISNTGELPGMVTLSRTDLVDQPGAGGGRLGDIADLVVTDVTSPQDPATVFSGDLAAMPSVSLGTFVPDEARTYDFTVSLPNAPAGSTPADINAYQASSLQVAYAWTGTAVDPADNPTPPPTDTPPPSPTSEATLTPPGGAPASPERTPTPDGPSAPPQGTPLDGEPGSRADPPPPQGSPPAAPQPAPPSSAPPTDAPHPTAGQESSSPAIAGSDGTTVGKRGPRASPAKGKSDRVGPNPSRAGRSADERGNALTGQTEPGHEPSGLSAVLDGLKRAAVAVAKKGAFPFLLVLLALGFFYLQAWLDRRDPKLALAPVDPEPTRSFD